MIIERLSPLKLIDIEPVLWNAARNRGATLAHREPVTAGVVFTIVHPVLYEKILSAEIRFAVFLPCRIAAFDHESGSRLIAMSPVQVAHDFQQADQAAAALEHLLIEILDALADPAVGRIGTGVGATEDQVSMGGTVGQRIDSCGSKIEDLGGTGELDSPGG